MGANSMEPISQTIAKVSTKSAIVATQFSALDKIRRSPTRYDIPVTKSPMVKIFIKETPQNPPKTTHRIAVTMTHLIRSPFIYCMDGILLSSFAFFSSPLDCPLLQHIRNRLSCEHPYLR